MGQDHGEKDTIKEDMIRKSYQSGALDQKSGTYAEDQMNRTIASATGDEYSSFQITASLGQSRLNTTDASTDAKSVLGSTFSPQISAKWSQHWSSGFKTFLGAGIQKESFQTTSSTHTLSNEKPLLTNIELGVGVLNTPKFQMDLSLGLESINFMRATNSTTLTLDTVSTPTARLAAEYTFLQSTEFSLSALMGAKYFMGSTQSSYTVDSGYGYDLGLLVKHEGARSTPFFGGVVFGAIEQNSSISNQSHMNASLVFGFSFDVGKSNTEAHDGLQ